MTMVENNEPKDEVTFNSPKPEKPKEVIHDQSPAIITDHPFVPMAEWWTRCRDCPPNARLAEAAHATSTLHPIGYISDNLEDL